MAETWERGSLAGKERWVGVAIRRIPSGLSPNQSNVTDEVTQKKKALTSGPSSPSAILTVKIEGGGFRIRRCSAAAAWASRMLSPDVEPRWVQYVERNASPSMPRSRTTARTAAGRPWEVRCAMTSLCVYRRTSPISNPKKTFYHHLTCKTIENPQNPSLKSLSKNFFPIHDRLTKHKKQNTPVDR